MKPLMIIILSAICFNKFSTAQIRKDSLLPYDSSIIQKQKITGDYLIFKNGKVMIMKNDSMTQLEKTIKLKNGTTVMSNGTVNTFDHHIIRLKQDDVVFFNGMIKRND